ncbi:response regulator [Bacillus sp. Bva_UNVM-123]
MSIKKIIFIVIIFLFVLTGCRLLWMNFFTTREHPHPVQGELDLREWEDLSESSITLDGEWEFYPQTFLIKSQLHGDDLLNHEKGYIQVPGNWAESKEDASTYGFGSYRLKIQVDPEEDKTYGLYIPYIANSSDVYVNGKLLSSIGKPGENKQQYTPLNAPKTVYFTLEETNEIELIIQAANYDDPLSGGIVRSMKFGLADPLYKDIGFATNIVLVSIIIYLFHALYIFILFLMGNQNKLLLYFSFMTICIIVGTLIGERLLFAWFPLNFEWGIKVIYLTIITGGYLLLQCIREQLPVILRIKIIKWYAVLCSIAVFIILLSPATLNIKLTAFYIFVMLIPCLLAPFVMYRATLKIDKDSIFLLLALVASIGSLIWLIIIYLLQLDIVSYPFDLMIAIICFSMYWFKKYFRVLGESQKLTKKLQEADKRKDEFLVTVAHEMRTPLHGIINISHSIMEKEHALLDKKSVQSLDLIMTVGRRMSLLLNDLLDLARFKENRITIHPKDVSVHSAVEAVIAMLVSMSEGKSIRLVNRIPVHFPLVQVDENRLTQILFNLLYNALKHSHADEVLVEAEIEEEKAKISVVDNGIGIEEEHLGKIFEPYEQASNRNTTSTDGGFGLGLSICKQLVELHGGELAVSSKVNQGSVFTFTLTLSDIAAQQKGIEAFTANVIEQSASAEAFVSNNLVKHQELNSESIHILAVDDDPVNLKVLESIFSVPPYQISTTISAEEVLLMLNIGKWDLIIADVMMPKMSGYTLTSRIRERYSMFELPILLLTAYNRDEDIETGFRLGANDYVTKPMNAVELKSRVKSLTKLKRSVSERLQIEGAWLQAQIKPHFLINTFNAIVGLSRTDLDRMDDLIEELANYTRLSIDFQNADGVVPLKHELQLVRSYLHILKERFGNRVEAIWEVDDNIQLDLPPLTIQTLVENAVNHGILKRMNGGEVYICIKDKEQFVEISVKDNGVGMDEETLKHLLTRGEKSDKRSGIGLLNTERRLKQLFGNVLKIESKLGEGTTISFTIPKTRLSV